MTKLDRQDWAAQLAFRSFGVRIGIRVNEPEILEQVVQRIPRGSMRSESCTVDRLYSILVATTARAHLRRFHFLLADIGIVSRTSSLAVLFDAFESDLHSYIGQASRRWFFVHAGVVAWKRSAIVAPGRSLSGKTTLVSEFLRAGAEYYSDEFAAFDSQGFVHPFPRRLSVRQDGGEERHRLLPEQLGSKAGDTPLPVGLLISTQYKPGVRWRPRQSSQGSGVLALLENSLSAQRAPVQTIQASRESYDSR